jgi:hypothetical protein
MNHSPVISTIGPASANDQINNNVEIIVHINETLDGVTRNGLQAALLEDKGVTRQSSARFAITCFWFNTTGQNLILETYSQKWWREISLHRSWVRFDKTTAVEYRHNISAYPGFRNYLVTLKTAVYKRRPSIDTLVA